MARIRLDQAQLNRTLRGVSRREGDAAARQVVARAKILAPVDTGRLRASIRVERRSLLGFRNRWTIGSDVSYAEMVHDGTRPHIIRPKTAKALRFKVGGRIVYARMVRHPGTRARPFLDRALREVAAARGFDFRSG
jgi:hypothetical protein